MTDLDLAVDVFVVARPDRVAAAVHEAARWPGWWPDLTLTVLEDRGQDGLRWSVAGAVLGSAELWLEPVLDGVVVHWFLRGRLDGGSAGRERARRTQSWLRAALALKDELEAGRPAGVKPRPDDADE